MATYVLIAGAWHGSWCWTQVLPFLKLAGHRVLTPDLLSVDDGRHSLSLDPLRIWTDQIVELVEAQDEPVILVGHSRAGLVISGVAERVPEKIGLLVYLSAFLLKDGQTLNEIAQHASNAEAFVGELRFADDGSCTISSKGVENFLYNKTPEPLVHLAFERLKPEPTKAFATPIHVTEARFGSVRRVYVACRYDQTIPYALQQAMQQASPVAYDVTLESDHSPFFSQPAELVAALEHVRQAS
jgi:pimeloyl-ACP methyl ester carboxylesterase